jgi:drug/metabolite transporter (DMT)-like permease
VEVVFGGIASVIWGVADFLGGEASKRGSAASVVLWSGLIAFPILVVAALVVGGQATVADFGYGALAGTLGGLGLISLYAGLSQARAAAVAPVSAAVGTTVPVVVALLGGERPSTIAWVGVLLAVPAVMLCAWVTEPGGRRSAGFIYGLAAGLGFGGFTVILNLTSPESNLLPLITSRGAAVVLILVVAGLGLWKVSGPAGLPMKLVAVTGIADVTANVFLLLALRSGSLALATVASEFYPAVTVILARIVNHEHLNARQGLGLVLALLAMTAIAIG